MAELLIEVRKMSVVNSEFIIQYRTSAIYQGHFYIMMELIDGVKYRDIVVARQATSVPFKEDQVLAWAKQIALGLSHLHNVCKVVHQDLHNGNVMITKLVKSQIGGIIDVGDDALSTTSVKLLNLGLASFKSDYAHHTTSRTKLLRTMRARPTKTNRAQRASFVQLPAEVIGGFKAIRAPEMHPSGSGSSIQGNMMVHFDGKVDVWSLGILLTEAALLSPIEEWYAERATMQGFGHSPLLQAAKISEVAGRSAVLGEVVTKLLTQNPNQRISAFRLAGELDSGNVCQVPSGSLL